MTLLASANVTSPVAITASVPWRLGREKGGKYIDSTCRTPFWGWLGYLFGRVTMHIYAVYSNDSCISTRTDSLWGRLVMPPLTRTACLAAYLSLFDFLQMIRQLNPEIYRPEASHATWSLVEEMMDDP